MPDDTGQRPFDMPKTGTFEQRGGWITNQLSVDLGLTLVQAAGMVGNLGFESAGLKTLQEIAPVAGGRGGWGWAQWTGPRRVAFERWATAHHLSFASDEANYGYLLEELRTTQAATVRALKTMKTVEAAVFSVGQTFERPGGTTPIHLPGNDGRLMYAKRALAGAQVVQSGDDTLVAPIRSAVDRVKDVQTILAEDGLYTGDIDGKVGAKRASGNTRDAFEKLAAQAWAELQAS